MKIDPGELVYLASPYSHGDMGVRYSRYKEVSRVAGYLMAKYGLIIFCPIAHSYSIADNSPFDDMDHKAWMNIDITILNRCDHLLVLKLAGWEESKGVAEEIEFATTAGIPITYISQEDI